MEVEGLDINDLRQLRSNIQDDIKNIQNKASVLFKSFLEWDGEVYPHDVRHIYQIVIDATIDWDIDLSSTNINKKILKFFNETYDYER